MYFISGLRLANENMDKLMGRLETLSVAIGQLNPASSEKNSPEISGGSGSGISQNGAKMSLDSHKIDRWQRENHDSNEEQRTKAKRKLLVRQKKSIATDDDEISETQWNNMPISFLM